MGSKKGGSTKIETLHVPANGVKPTGEVYLSEEEIALRQAANEAVQAATVQSMPYDKYIKAWDHDWNPGKRAPDAFLPLYEEIKAVGMNTMPLVYVDPKSGKIRGLRGYVRSQAVQYMHDNDNAAFEQRFGKGIPVSIINTELSEAQQYYLACDHNTITRSRMAVIDQGIEMFRTGHSEKDIALQLYDELEQVFTPISADRKAKIKAATTVSAKIKEMAEARRGVTQFIAHLAELPDEVYNAYRTGVEGGEGFRLGMSDVNDLHKANKEGRKMSERKNPTAAYKSMLDLLQKNAGKPKEAVDRPINASAMDQWAGQVGSKTLKLCYYAFRFGKKVAFDELDSILIDLENAGEIPAAVLENVPVWDKEMAEQQQQKKAGSTPTTPAVATAAK